MDQPYNLYGLYIANNTWLVPETCHITRYLDVVILPLVIFSCLIKSMSHLRVCFVFYHVFACWDCMSFAGTVIRDEMGFTLEKAGKEVLGTSTKVVITKDSTLIVTDGSTQPAVKQRVSQLQNLVKVDIISSVLFHAIWYFSCTSLLIPHLVEGLKGQY